jgi:hypothetical protein
MLASKLKIAVDNLEIEAVCPRKYKQKEQPAFAQYKSWRISEARNRTV